MFESALVQFIMESNSIEGIRREPTEGEISMLDNFLDLSHDKLTIEDLIAFVKEYEPSARLRLNGENAYVGDHVAPVGGASISYWLDEILGDINEGILSPYEAHCEYETLHPFTDCNGRSGRAIWAWMMTREGEDLQPFLQTFYYQSLSQYRTGVRA